MTDVKKPTGPGGKMETEAERLERETNEKLEKERLEREQRGNTPPTTPPPRE